jgi:diguanylate cyclase (GGDEF)-like protein/PAS domain S-box-containing protein
VRRGFEHGIDLLESVAALWAGSLDVTRSQFRDFTTPLLDNHRSVRAIAWLPRIVTAETDLFPVEYLEPLSGNEATRGLDVASIPACLTCLERAQATGELTATGRISMPRDEADDYSLLMFEPVYREDGFGSSDSKQQDLIGFAAILYRAADLIEESLAVPEPVGIDLLVLDDSAPIDEKWLYFHRSRLRERRVESEETVESLRQSDLRYAVSFTLGGRTWTVLMVPTPGFFEPAARWIPHVVLLVGLLLTGGVSNHLRLLRKRAIELTRSNELLNKEIEQRRQVEENLQLFQSLMHNSAESIFVIDPETSRFLYANKQAAQRLGRDGREMLQLTVPDIAVDGPFVRMTGGWDGWVESLENAPVRVVEGRHRHKDGSTFPVELSVSLVTVGTRRFVVAIAEDISRRKEREKVMVEVHDRLVELSSIDGLTGIANRRRFDEGLASEWKRAVRRASPLSLIIADIDHFKLFNDRYGHLAGDDCLKRVAQVFSSLAARPADLVARFGGEEIAVLLPETSEAGSKALAERIRHSVAELAIPHEDSSAGSVVTLSLGVASTIPTHGTSMRELVEAADAALYRAKHAGRNRTLVASS